jgi:hypothetical protein
MIASTAFSVIPPCNRDKLAVAETSGDPDAVAFSASLSRLKLKPL